MRQTRTRRHLTAFLKVSARPGKCTWRAGDTAFWYLIPIFFCLNVSFPAFALREQATAESNRYSGLEEALKDSAGLEELRVLVLSRDGIFHDGVRKMITREFPGSIVEAAYDEEEAQKGLKNQPDLVIAEKRNYSNRANSAFDAERFLAEAKAKAFPIATILVDGVTDAPREGSPEGNLPPLPAGVDERVFYGTGMHSDIHRIIQKSRFYTGLEEDEVRATELPDAPQGLTAGGQVAWYRERRGWSQRELSRRTGESVRHSEISRIESGRAFPFKTDDLNTILSTLELSPKQTERLRADFVEARVKRVYERYAPSQLPSLGMSWLGSTVFRERYQGQLPNIEARLQEDGLGFKDFRDAMVVRQPSVKEGAPSEFIEITVYVHGEYDVEEAVRILELAHVPGVRFHVEPFPFGSPAEHPGIIFFSHPLDRKVEGILEVEIPKKLEEVKEFMARIDPTVVALAALDPKTVLSRVPSDLSLLDYLLDLKVKAVDFTEADGSRLTAYFV